MSATKKSDLLRRTADEFDQIMEQFDRTKANLVDALTKADLKEDAIAKHVRAFDEGKTLIGELLPIRDNVEAMKSAIIGPVATVIADSSDTNKRFGYAGIAFAAIGIFLTVSLPYLPFIAKSHENKPILDKLDELRDVLKPAIEQRTSASAQLLLYDRFETDTASLYEVPRLLDIGAIGFAHGYESVGFQPMPQLIYKPIDVPCEKGCRLSFEAMVRLTENIGISAKQIRENKFSPVSPIEIQYASANQQKWQILEPLQSTIRVEWIGKRNQWQSVKTPYVVVPSNLGVTKIKLLLREYQWTKAGDPGQKPVRSPIDFDEVKIFASALR